MLKKELEQELNRTKLVLDYAREELNKHIKEGIEKDKEIKRLKVLLEKYDKELKHKTEQYEYLRHYHNLSLMKQLQQKENIIKEVREYIEEAIISESTEFYGLIDGEHILAILERENK